MSLPANVPIAIATAERNWIESWPTAPPPWEIFQEERSRIYSIRLRTPRNLGNNYIEEAGTNYVTLEAVLSALEDPSDLTALPLGGELPRVLAENVFAALAATPGFEVDWTHVEVVGDGGPGISYMHQPPVP